MGMPVRIDDTLYEQARAEAKVERRTIAGQIEFWAMVGRAALDNPDLPVTFVAETLLSMSEPREHATPLVPRGPKASVSKSFRQGGLPGNTRNFTTISSSMSMLPLLQSQPNRRSGNAKRQIWQACMSTNSAVRDSFTCLVTPLRKRCG